MGLQIIVADLDLNFGDPGASTLRIEIEPGNAILVRKGGDCDLLLFTAGESNGEVYLGTGDRLQILILDDDKEGLPA